MHFSGVPPVIERNLVAALSDNFEDSVSDPESQEKEEPIPVSHKLIELQSEDVSRGKGEQRSIQVMLHCIRQCIADSLS
jgi:hypothetical protein